MLKGHTRSVRSVAFSPDGKLLATAAESVKVWEVATAREVKTLGAFHIGVACLAFSPDGHLLATTGFNQPARVYEVKSWKRLHQLAGFPGGTNQVAFTPDGKVLATLQFDGLVRLWDPASGEDMGLLTPDVVGPARLAYSPDGKTMALGGHTTAVLWDVARGEPRARLEHRGSVFSLAFAPDGKTLATVDLGLPARVRLWDVATGKCKIELSLKKRYTQVRAAAFSPDGKTLAVVGDAHVVLYDAASGEDRFIVKTPILGDCVAFSPDGRTLAVGTWDNCARLYDVPGKE